jgi:hypothetical protein
VRGLIGALMRTFQHDSNTNTWGNGLAELLFIGVILLLLILIRGDCGT